MQALKLMGMQRHNTTQKKPCSDKLCWEKGSLKDGMEIELIH